MGKRSVKATKSGKFMNPTDQARKEARKKELKKNKKQRLFVRTSVLKNKDPGVIIEELDKLDELEYNVHEPPQLAEKVLKDKRRKLKETLERVMRLYQKEEPTYWNELKQIEADYERRRFHRIQHYEAVKQAEAVSNVEDIPLPPTQDFDPSVPPPPVPSSIVEEPKRPLGILKTAVVTIQESAVQYLGPDGQEPPGVPAIPPPEFSSSESEESGGEEADGDFEMDNITDIPSPSGGNLAASDTADTTNEHTLVKTKKSVRFDTSRDVNAIDEMDRFMKEVEQEFHSMKEEELNPPGVESATGKASKDDETSDERAIPSSTTNSTGKPLLSQQTMRPPPSYFVVGSRPFFPFPPPPLNCGSMTVPPPPPPPPPPRLRFANSRFRQIPPPRLVQTSIPSTGITKAGEAKIVSEAMIQAKPQIRSLSADVTRFVPVAVKTRREDHGPNKEWKPNTIHPPVKSQATASKDAAYEDFMKEMQSLL